MKKLTIFALSSFLSLSALAEQKAKQCRAGYKPVMCHSAEGKKIDGAKRSSFCWKEKKNISEKKKARICKRDKKMKKTKKVALNTK